MRPSIYITQPVAESAIERLRKVAEVEVNPDASRVPDKELVIAAVRKHDILFALLHDKIDRDVIAANPKLRAIATMALNPANVDVKEATARKIPVSVIAGAAVVETTADITFALLLAAARNIPQADRFLRRVVSRGAILLFFGEPASSARSLGWSAAGDELRRRWRGARAASTCASSIVARTGWSKRKESQLQMTYLPLDQLLKESDFVSIHASMRPETHHLIGERELDLMKPTAILINTSRGPIVDEAALARALAGKRIAAAGSGCFRERAEDRTRADAVAERRHGSSYRERGPGGPGGDGERSGR